MYELQYILIEYLDDLYGILVIENIFNLLDRNLQLTQDYDLLEPLYRIFVINPIRITILATAFYQFDFFIITQHSS